MKRSPLHAGDLRRAFGDALGLALAEQVWAELRPENDAPESTHQDSTRALEHENDEQRLSDQAAC